MHNPVDFLVQFLNRFDEGKIFLPYGIHVHKITTKSKPESVWFGEVNTTGIPVCQGSVNLYGFTLVDDGFILYADISSDTAELEWQAVMEA